MGKSTESESSFRRRPLADALFFNFCGEKLEAVKSVASHAVNKLSLLGPKELDYYSDYVPDEDTYDPCDPANVISATEIEVAELIRESNRKQLEHLERVVSH